MRTKDERAEYNKEYSKKWRETHREYIKICKREWAEANPDKRKEYKRKYNELHREKINAENRKRYLDNPDLVKAQKKKSAAKHPDYRKKWREANPEKAKEKDQRDYKKAVSTPKGKLKRRMTCAIWRTIHDSKANRSWESLVGYTVDQLKQHIEKLFKEGMSWDNYGTVWEIDHKIPVAVFNFEKPEDIDFRLCWSLKNLQPLPVSENRRKQTTIEKPFQPSLRMVL